MARITIICSEKEKENIMQGFEWNCPFESCTDDCGEESSCIDCLKKNIEFATSK